MFEIVGTDVSNLNDADLRSLVAQLATAELRARGYPLSSVTAGGEQDAPDGGLDVRVECPRDIINPDFVPRGLTGFQVKKPDMPAAAIRAEMRPRGILRDVIRQLAQASGAYIIVSAEGSVADKPLADRRRAMREAVFDLPEAAQLHIDFYDRNRVATWVTQYPGISAWVRSTVGRPLAGWSGIADWEVRGKKNANAYLFDDHACLVDARSRESNPLTIPEGIVRLRKGLRTPGQCIRLVGLSGVGKTRLVQALFEPGVGDDPLDSSIAIYTDYSEETSPSAREMARELMARGQRAILIVDNCNPGTHSDLARLCGNDGRYLSLLTVEYDVRDDEPEYTEVFRLQSASRELVTAWVKDGFPHVSQLDRERIAEFSDGNFRVAGALAQTVRKGETLGSLKSRDVFERIFRQRNEPNQQLLAAAEDLSLLYSVEGTNVSDGGELAQVGTIRGVGARPLYEALAEMRRRGVVQARGRFRAILPQAIANVLAAHALERIPAADFDYFCTRLSQRMIHSASRRLGFLHDSKNAQSTVSRWMEPDGPLGNLFEGDDDRWKIVHNIAPVAPEIVLGRLEQELAGLAPDAPQRRHWVSLIKNIGYESDLFDRAVNLLAPFAGAEAENNNLNSARNAFSSFFHIVLSGTQATPQQRSSAIRRLAASSDENIRRSLPIAVDALLQSGHFMSSSGHEFGARPRDWGWRPQINKEASDWFESAIALAIEVLPDVDARVLLAKHSRELWHHSSCRQALERAATTFLKEQPWIEGWTAFRATLRFDGKDMRPEVRAQLEQLIERVKPADLLNQARAVVLNRMPGGGGWDFADGEEDDGEASDAWKKADRMAQEVGRWLVHDAAVRAKFLPEVLAAPHALRAFECGRGLAEDAQNLDAIWREIVSVYTAVDCNTRDARLLGGFICEAHRRDKAFTSVELEAATENCDLAAVLPYLQARAAIDTEGIARLRRAIDKGVIAAANFRQIANGSVSDSPAEDLADLLIDISQMSGGVEVALEILHMHFFRHHEEECDWNAHLVSVGRDLLMRADWSREGLLRDYAAGIVIGVCLDGPEGRGVAEVVCKKLCTALDAYQVSSYNLHHTLMALMKTQPFATLDVLLLSTPPHGLRNRFDFEFPNGPSLASLGQPTLQTWADRDPPTRYPLLGQCLSMFGRRNNEEQNEMSPLFLSMLDHAPDKRLFLGDAWHRMHPHSWSGSLAHILGQRKTQLSKLAERADPEVQAWAREVEPQIDRWIEQDRLHDRLSEEAFE